MDHLREIEDWPTRAAVDLYQTQMEFLVLKLLHKDRDIALTKLVEARDAALSHLKNLGSDFIPMGDEMKSTRIALAILENTFDRLMSAVQSPKDDNQA